MEIQGKKLKFGFRSASKFDEIAKERNHRTLFGIMRSFGEEQKRLEKKYKKSFDRLTDEQKSEHSVDLNMNEVGSLVYAGLDMEYDEAIDLIDKEMESAGLSAFELASNIFMTFAQSALFTSMKVKEENPKKPK